MNFQIPPPLLDHPEYLTHYRWMSRAIALAHSAGEAGDVPVGAVIVDPENGLVAEGENRRERDHDPTAHAEIVAIRAAGRSLETWHLTTCTLYVTLEPCPMCTGAMIQARLARVVYGVDDLKAGTVRSVLNLLDSPCSNHRMAVVSGILETTCRQQLQSWFKRHRQQ